MSKYAFTIEFSTAFSINKDAKKKVYFKYQASARMISRSFNLFQIGSIRRMTKEGLVGLSGSYYLTSYPFCNCKEHIWRDALTLQTNDLMQAIGDTIDQYLLQADCSFLPNSL